ncbi:ATP-binding protein [Corynebacterium cystitidis]|uniref:DNA replication protein DnaC n=1 Tax=Corynebacterium cystitidis DSM 20524 TaxID=1121357 RepID=A0A1H9UUD7_9CORY|nr:ATP-binding protein [Corynebacterium cystitidis]WJY83720.1 transposase [Corynebacterium cystitidis DSM 20524]SES12734.1 DNA replication protein DnaC [Corynebacterium cystitidis DSM 20524]SNV91156.1 transposase [Corynebacterium cystitidis]
MSEEELKEQFSRAKIATAGARALEMLADPAYDHFSFYDFLCEMMLAQDTNRKANATRKAIAGAHFANPNISIEHINPNPETGLSAQRLARLKDSEWIIGPNTQNLIIIGPTGSGTSYLAQAIGVNACINQLKVRYWRLAELARHFDALRDNTFALDSLTQQLAKYHLLIIDDFYTTEISRHASSLLFSLMDAREGQATVIVSQLEPQDWMKQIPNQVTAESLINRILHPSMVIRLDGKTNLRAQHNPSEAI